MLFLPILNLFLYFPEDKSEYIPAAIKLVICIIIAVVVFRLIIKHSKKEQAKAEELEKQIMNQDKNNTLK
ncbi:hypothetical protein RGU12_17970 [Fredinandcohnia sp. QZ13]|uniref:hypothetical protein n=1 Tax=Fredinandcohnia sp. QZ13 TaxID=3073144 RepID=UPI0028532BF0|nr:hypothetical protein [Fredinandcohnia sp. QZ13]MDR4889381.1 hypothetical protein [Fredinandcohnia sp. QZ13]